MPVTRRSVLLGSAAFVALATTSCGPFFPGGGSAGNGADFADADAVTNALRELAKDAGGEKFQSLGIQEGNYLNAKMLTADGGLQEYTYTESDDAWEKGSYKEKDIFTSPESVTIAALHLDRLDKYLDVAQGKGELRILAFEIDYVGKVGVTAHTDSSDPVGLDPRGTGTVPNLDPEEAADVKQAVAEIVATYGTEAERVGSFNGFVHVDANVEGSEAGLRIVRYPRLAAQAKVTEETRFAAEALFDPGGFDPTTAIERKATVAADAGVDGKVWDWQYRRPPKGGEPMVSYGIGPSGPSTRVWTDADGKVTAVVASKDCKPSSRFCPA